jgi:hypothetical protein
MIGMPTTQWRFTASVHTSARSLDQRQIRMVRVVAPICLFALEHLLSRHTPQWCSVLRRAAVEMRRLAAILVGAGVVLLLVGSLIPIKGSNIMGSGVAVSCGPALPAAMHWTGPPEQGGATILTGPDTGLTTSAWCELEAGRWMLPTYLAGAGSLALAAILAVRIIAARSSRVPVSRSRS